MKTKVVLQDAEESYYIYISLEDLLQDSSKLQESADIYMDTNPGMAMIVQLLIPPKIFRQNYVIKITIGKILDEI